MLCEMCGKNQATTFLTLVINDKVKKAHLCSACAASSGLKDAASVSITDVLLGLGSEKEPSEAKPKVCPQCRMSFVDFKKVSRLGCPACYEAFSTELEPLLEAMHRGKQHVGKLPACIVQDTPSLTQLTELREALDAAVQAEDYEAAARFRDQIRECLNKPVRSPPKKTS